MRMPTQTMTALHCRCNCSLFFFFSCSFAFQCLSCLLVFLLLFFCGCSCSFGSRVCLCKTFIVQTRVSFVITRRCAVHTSANRRSVLPLSRPILHRCFIRAQKSTGKRPLNVLHVIQISFAKKNGWNSYVLPTSHFHTFPHKYKRLCQNHNNRPINTTVARQIACTARCVHFQQLTYEFHHFHNRTRLFTSTHMSAHPHKPHKPYTHMHVHIAVQDLPPSLLRTPYTHTHSHTRVHTRAHTPTAVLTHCVSPPSPRCASPLPRCASPLAA